MLFQMKRKLKILKKNLMKNSKESLDLFNHHAKILYKSNIFLIKAKNMLELLAVYISENKILK